MGKIQKMTSEQMSKVVGGNFKYVASATGATITCVAGALHVGCLIAAMATHNHEHKVNLYKAAGGLAVVSLTGLISTTAISKVGGRRGTLAMI